VLHNTCHCQSQAAGDAKPDTLKKHHRTVVTCQGQDSDETEPEPQVPKLKPGSGPRSERRSGNALATEDEDILTLDAEELAPHALGAPAARLSDQAQQASAGFQTKQWGNQADSAVAGVAAPGLANLGRRLSPGPAPDQARRALPAPSLQISHQVVSLISNTLLRCSTLVALASSMAPLAYKSLGTSEMSCLRIALCPLRLRLHSLLSAVQASRAMAWVLAPVIMRCRLAASAK